MKENRIRKILQEGKCSVSTRLWSPWPLFTEAVGSTGQYDYVEFITEYAPFSQDDLENIARAAELHNMGSMLKVDFQERGFFAQKAIASGFQAILFTDCHNAEEVRESIRYIRPETNEDHGLLGYAKRRYIGFQPAPPQVDHAERLRENVCAFMIEKAEAVRNIDEICSVSGVDIIQFGPSDYNLSLNRNAKGHEEETREIEKHVISTALSHGVHPRCEIQTAEAAEYYMKLGVRHFSIGDQFTILLNTWARNGADLWNRIKDI